MEGDGAFNSLMMLGGGNISSLIVDKLMSWNHSGFNVHIDSVISPDNREGGERAARYSVRPPISLEKMQYFPDEEKVIYDKPGGEKKTFDAIDFLIPATSHIVNRLEHRVTYFDW